MGIGIQPNMLAPEWMNPGSDRNTDLFIASERQPKNLKTVVHGRTESTTKVLIQCYSFKQLFVW
jgi:hypothetical protein